MKALDLFLPLVLPYAPGCSDQMAYQALRQTAIDFCMRSALVQRITQSDIVADTQDYDITVPSDMVFSQVLGVGWQGQWLTPVSPDQVLSDVALIGAAIGIAEPLSGSPSFYFQKLPTDATVSLYPIPDTALTNGLTIKAAFFPAEDATTVEDALYDDYAAAIAAGALMRLVTTPNQMFTAPTMAPAYLATYERGVSAAKRQKQRGKLPSDLRVRPQRFA